MAITQKEQLTNEEKIISNIESVNENFKILMRGYSAEKTEKPIPKIYAAIIDTILFKINDSVEQITESGIKIKTNYLGLNCTIPTANDIFNEIKNTVLPIMKAAKNNTEQKEIMLSFLGRKLQQIARILQTVKNTGNWQ